VEEECFENFPLDFPFLYVLHLPRKKDFVTLYEGEIFMNENKCDEN
jgi:hypothetical protein